MSKHIVEVIFKFRYTIDTEQYEVDSIEEAIEIDMENMGDPYTVAEISEGHSPTVTVAEVVNYADKEDTDDGA